MSPADLQANIELLYGRSIYFYAAMLIDLILKGFALWKAGRLNEKNWFWAILIFNTMGILPIFYLVTRRNQKI